MRFCALLLAALPLGSQWLNYREPDTPRTSDGKPNLTALAPRINGKPDLSGVWQAERPPESAGGELAKLQVDFSDLGKYAGSLFMGVKPGEEPLRPEARAIAQKRTMLDYPPTHCLPYGLPNGIFTYSFKMIQAPRELVILHEGGDPPRQIFTDGRSLPKDPQPSWMGYSVGQWQGDTLVVETIGLNDKSWLDARGNPRSEDMHIRERYHRVDFGHMDLELTIDDKTFYTRPFTIGIRLSLIPDSDILEFVCNENEKDRTHMQKP